MIDAATVMACVSCALVFAAWLFLPHRTATEETTEITLREREDVTTAA
jgi:hypothetical protein